MHQTLPGLAKILTSSVLLNAVRNMMTELFSHPLRGQTEKMNFGLRCLGAIRILGPLYSFQGDADDQVQGHEGWPQRGAIDRTARARDSGVWVGGFYADRPRGEHAPNQREQPE